MNVKIIEEDSPYDLERRVNNIINTLNPDELFQIQYSVNKNGCADTDCYSAMVVYK